MRPDSLNMDPQVMLEAYNKIYNTGNPPPDSPWLTAFGFILIALVLTLVITLFIFLFKYLIKKVFRRKIV